MPLTVRRSCPRLILGLVLGAALHAVCAPSALAAWPSIQEAVRRAKLQAPQVQIATAQEGLGQAARQGAAVSRLLNPQVELRGDRGGRGVTDDVQLQLAVALPVEVGSQPRARQAEATALVDLLGAGRTMAEAQAAGDAVRAWSGLAIAAWRLHLLDAFAETSRQEAKALQTRARLGDLRDPDLRLALVELSRNILNAQETRAEIERRLVELQQLTGLEPALEDLPATLDLPAVPTRAALDAAPAVRVAGAEAEWLAQTHKRLEQDAKPPLAVLLTTGRGDVGELRVGAGVAWSLALTRTNQGERARAGAERQRALTEQRVRLRSAENLWVSLERERIQLRAALQELDAVGVPAAAAAVTAEVATLRAGKGNLVTVLLARRTWIELQLRRLGLVQRDWDILSTQVALTGELP